MAKRILKKGLAVVAGASSGIGYELAACAADATVKETPPESARAEKEWNLNHDLRDMKEGKSRG